MFVANADRRWDVYRPALSLSLSVSLTNTHTHTEVAIHVVAYVQLASHCPESLPLSQPRLALSTNRRGDTREKSGIT